MNMSDDQEFAGATLVASESFEHLAQEASTPSRPMGLPLPHDLLVAAMDEVGHGLVILDADGRVLSANRLALRFFDCSPTLTVKHQYLVAESSADAQVFQRALAAACQGRRTMVKLGRGHDVMMVAVVPLPRSEAGVLPCSLLVFSRKEACESLSLQFFATMHNLTLAELGVLHALNRGHAPLQVAAAGRVAVSTVRTHISSLRQKTGAHSINHLLRMLAGLPPLVSKVDASEAQI